VAVTDLSVSGALTFADGSTMETAVTDSLSITDITFPDGSSMHTAPADTLAHNLVSNGMMTALSADGVRPQGFSTNMYRCSGCSIAVEAVHPFVQCFEGPYWSECKGTCASSCAEATQGEPFYFGRYYKGPRVARGGLGDGWGGIRNGHIMRIAGNRPAETGNCQSTAVTFPTEARHVSSKVLFRAWIKVVKGGCNLGTDVCGGPKWTVATGESWADGWEMIHAYVGGSHVSNLDAGHVFQLKCYGEGASPGYAGDFEAYLALPYMANVVEPDGSDEDDTPHWSSSVWDSMADRGVHINLEKDGDVAVTDLSVSGDLSVSQLTMSGHATLNSVLFNSARRSSDGGSWFEVISPRVYQSGGGGQGTQVYDLFLVQNNYHWGGTQLLIDLFTEYFTPGWKRYFYQNNGGNYQQGGKLQTVNDFGGNCFVEINSVSNSEQNVDGGPIWTAKVSLRVPEYCYCMVKVQGTALSADLWDENNGNVQPSAGRGIQWLRGPLR